MVFPVVMYGCKSWTVKKAERRRIDTFELWCWRRLLGVPWTARSNQSILKEISPGCWRPVAKTETPILWPPHAKSWPIGKDSDAGRDWGQEEKGTTEDEMAGWHHRLNGHEFGWTPGVGDGQGGLACCNSWDCRELDTIEWLNWTELKPYWNLHCPMWWVSQVVIVVICQCRGLKRCRFDLWVQKIPWWRKWQPTPVFLPGESHGHRSLAGYRL